MNGYENHRDRARGQLGFKIDPDTKHAVRMPLADYLTLHNGNFSAPG